MYNLRNGVIFPIMRPISSAAAAIIAVGFFICIRRSEIELKIMFCSRKKVHGVGIGPSFSRLDVHLIGFCKINKPVPIFFLRCLYLSVSVKKLRWNVLKISANSEKSTPRCAIGTPGLLRHDECVFLDQSNAKCVAAVSLGAAIICSGVQIL